MPSAADTGAVVLRGAGLRLGGRDIWRDLDLTVGTGEFVAVLGPNGAGKTTLLKVLLGLLPLTRGEVSVCGQPPRRGRRHVGYVPQQRSFDPALPLRGRDLVALGADGHRAGLATGRGGRHRERIDGAIAAVGAADFADAPVGLLSGGEQQRLRIAQAMLNEPDVLLCDEPLLSLDLSHQRAVSALIDERRRTGTAVLFVTHEINPVLSYVDRVLYLVGGRSTVGRPDEVLTSERLSALYGTPVDVLRVRDRIVVIGADDDPTDLAGHHHHETASHGSGGRRR